MSVLYKNVVVIRPASEPSLRWFEILTPGWAFLTFLRPRRKGRDFLPKPACYRSLGCWFVCLLFSFLKPLYLHLQHNCKFRWMFKEVLVGYFWSQIQIGWKEGCNLSLTSLMETVINIMIITCNTPVSPQVQVPIMSHFSG